MKNQLKFASLLLLFVLLVLLVSSYLGAAPDFDEDRLFYVSVLAVSGFVFVAFFKIISGEKFEWFGIFNLFSVSFIVVHFQYAILARFYDDVSTSVKLWPYPEVSTQAVTIAAIGFVVFLLAYNLMWGKVRQNKKQGTDTGFGPIEIRGVFYCLFGGSVFLFALFLKFVGREYLGGAYAGSSNWEAGASYYFAAAEVFFNLTIIVEIYRMRMVNPKRSLLSYCLGFNKMLSLYILFFLTFQLYIGDRGPILSTGLILVGGYDTFFKRLGLKFFIPAACAGAIALSFISMYRTNQSNVSIEERVEKAKEKSEDKHYYEFTADLAGNIRNLNAAVAVVPYRYDYFAGTIQGGSIISAIPFWASLFKVKIKGWRLGMTSSQFNTLILLGPYARSGTGTTVVADCYLEAGIYSVVLLMALLGYFMGWIEATGKFTNSIYIIALYLQVLAFSFYWPRASLLGDLKMWTWSFGVLWLLRTTVFRRVTHWHRARSSRLVSKQAKIGNATG